DGRVAEALAELLDACAGTAGLDDRRLEVRIGLAELLSHDVGVRKNRRRTRDVDLVAGDGRAGEREHANDGRRRRAGDKLVAHTGLLNLGGDSGACGLTAPREPPPAPAPLRRAA